MDIATLIGIVSAFGLVAIAIAVGSGISLFFNLPSFMIVIGGTMGATMINYPLKDVLGAFAVVRNVFLSRPLSQEKLIKQFLAYSAKARKEGILTLEKEAKGADDLFLGKGLQLSVDGLEPRVIREILDTEVDSLRERHDLGAEIFSTMGAYAPALGMIGTLIGLVQMLQNMNDPDRIGPAMAVALLTTFYGSVLANLVCIPVAGKLRTRSREETRVKEMIIDGLVGLTNGDHPRIIEQKMMSYVPPRERKSHFKN